MSDKNAKYKRILSQIEELIIDERNPLAKMASINAILYHKMQNFFWVGFFLLSDNRLVVGPYQGPLACMELKKNTGVCWAAINNKKTISVPDVSEFPGHIACDARSKSEIAIPLRNKSGKIIGVLDVDSDRLYNFDETDVVFLEKIITLIGQGG